MLDYRDRSGWVEAGTEKQHYVKAGEAVSACHLLGLPWGLVRRPEPVRGRACKTCALTVARL